MATDYTFGIHIEADPIVAEERIRQALADEGFGILTEIDVQATLKEKLDVTMRPYRILGACNPALANQAIETDENIGALLPCNVVVRAHPDGGSEIVAADPQTMLAVSPRADDLADIATEAGKRLRRALDAVAAA
jgi:uncharacterized protein (DUF302 family)